MNPTKRTCSTRDAAFVAYGIDDGTVLIRATYYRLRMDEPRTVELTPDTVDRLTWTFRNEFARRADIADVPRLVDAAIADAASRTVHRYLDESPVDLRHELLPGFYRAVAELYCDYRTLAVDGHD